ncbi:hypothetical protein [Hymenobacter latericus]|uniref:hypothetical protein n=1 Tax=Hymenobacter sp. YIM 151858-1 TaxID=2987688 RepID=UPI00222636F9|nr:hypothetical protein [Hymenobacter sp. YIM 151858-1]UYZ59607.1 hypothetical protein OIS50_02140 [Hymenobacter sp. YIM 151858-1]
MRLSTPLLLLGACLQLGGCVPQYHIALKPASNATRWEGGLEMVSDEADSVEVSMAAASTAGNFLEFDVTLRNRSARAVVVAPEQFYLLASFPPAATPNAAAAVGPVRVPAIDPEETIRQLQLSAAFHEKKSTAIPAVEILSGINEIAQDLSSRKRKETDAQRDARNAAYHAEMNGYQQERTDHAVRAAALRDELRATETDLLRKTTLDAGFAVRGRVRFLRTADAADRLRVVLPVGGRALAAEFTQFRYRPNGYQPATAQAAPRALPAVSQPAPPAPATARP